MTQEDKTGDVPVRPAPEARLWIGYVVPMIAFIALTAIEGLDGLPLTYPALYSLKAIVVTIALIMSRKVIAKEVRFVVRMLGLGAFVGLVGYIGWVYIDQVTPHFKLLGVRTGFDPYTALREPMQRSLFLAIRFYGLVVMVPLMEEIFWRSFLLRWLTDPDFYKLQIGDFSRNAFLITSGAFAIAHPEWLAAFLYAAAMALLLRKSRSLFACVTAHAVTNLLLGIYILHTHNWKLW